MKILKGNEVLKGILWGFICLIILEGGTFYILQGFRIQRIWNYDNISFVLILIFIALISGLFGIGIAKINQKIKRIGIILVMLIFALILTGFAYNTWYNATHSTLDIIDYLR